MFPARYMSLALKIRLLRASCSKIDASANEAKGYHNPDNGSESYSSGNRNKYTGPSILIDPLCIHQTQNTLGMGSRHTSLPWRQR